MSWQNLTQEQLEALPTARLLNVYKLARTGTWCTCYCDMRCDCSEQRAPAERIKAILDQRGHVDTGRIKVTSRTGDPKLTGTWQRNWEWLNTLKPAEVREGPIKDLESAIGQQVYKTSGKPFKSKEVYNTVSGVTINPHTNRKAFTFVEDDSVVDAHICKLRTQK